MKETFPLTEHQRKLFIFKLNRSGEFFANMTGGIVARSKTAGFVRHVGYVDNQGLCFCGSGFASVYDAPCPELSEMHSRLREVYDFVVGGR